MKQSPNIFGPEISICRILYFYVVQTQNFMEMWFGGLKRGFWYTFELKGRKTCGLEAHAFPGVHKCLNIKDTEAQLRNMWASVLILTNMSSNVRNIRWHTKETCGLEVFPYVRNIRWHVRNIRWHTLDDILDKHVGLKHMHFHESISVSKFNYLYLGFRILFKKMEILWNYHRFNFYHYSLYHTK